MTAKGIYATGPATSQITAINNNENGKSTKVVSVADVKNSLNDSNSCILLANDPTEFDRADIFTAITFSKMVAERITSAFLLAISIKYARSVRSNNSKTNTVATPMANTQSVSVALFGTTRS